MNSVGKAVPRSFATATVVAALVPSWTHGLGAITAKFVANDAPFVWPLTVVAIASAVVVAALSLTRGVRFAAWAGIALGFIGMGVCQLFESGEWARALPLLALLPLASTASPWLFARLPAELDTRYGSWSLASVGLVFVSIFGVMQCARLTSFLADQEQGWFLLNDDPNYASHKCVGAYLYAAEMNARGVENIYDNDLYEAWNPEATPDTRLLHLPKPDPFIYPPQFLLLPHLAIQLTNDMAVVEQLLAALYFTLVWSVGIALALWVGGLTGLRALVLFPLIAGSPSVLSSIVGGQFHAATIFLAIGGMIAFATNRKTLGSGLLGFAIVSKIFPVLFLVLLAMRRKWDAIAWTLGALAVYTVLALAIVGSQPFEAFFTYHLPRLSDGSSTAFQEVLPDDPAARYMLAGFKGSYAGMLHKLVVVGAIDLSASAVITIGKTIGAMTLLVALFAMRRKESTNEERAIDWLALIGLASIAGPVAWVNIGVVQSLWLATFLTVRFGRSLPLALFLSAVWITGLLLLGTQPLGSWNPAVLMVWLSLLTALLMPLTFLGALLVRRGAQDQNLSGAHA